MKKKIIIGLAIYAILFLAGGLYVLHAIGSTTAKLDNLIMLHQVEILREHYLIQIRRVQTDLALRETSFAPDTDTMIAHVASMSRVVRTCFDCHHEPPVEDRLIGLAASTENYKEALSRVLTVRADAARLEREKEAAFRTGEALIEEVSNMIALTGARLEASTARALAGIRKTTQVLLILLAIAPLISIVLSIVLVRGLTRPLGALVDSTRRIAGGDLDHRVSGLTNEFGELGAALNNMASSLSEQIAARERSEQMARLGRLSAGLAHEVKNPLAGIKVAMEILASETTISDENREVAHKVREEVGRVETLMRSFLSFARPPKPTPAEIDVRLLLDSLLSLHGRDRRFATAPEQGGIRLVRDFQEVPLVVADPMQIEQVLLNLFLNAVESMPKGGELRVSTHGAPGGRSVRIEIADTGKGVAPENAERIFEPFFTTKPRGTGLGLAISRQLVTQNGGTLTVSPNPGGGALFALALPVAGAPAAAAGGAAA